MAEDSDGRDGKPSAQLEKQPPDASRMTDDEMNRVVELINGKRAGAEDRPCPHCDANAWLLAPHTVTPIRLRRLTGGMELGGPVYPHAMIICTNCGYTRHFNLVVLGLEQYQVSEQDGGDDGQ